MNRLSETKESTPVKTITKVNKSKSKKLSKTKREFLKRLLAKEQFEPVFEDIGTGIDIEHG